MTSLEPILSKIRNDGQSHALRASHALGSSVSFSTKLELMPRVHPVTLFDEMGWGPLIVGNLLTSLAFYVALLAEGRSEDANAAVEFANASLMGNYPLIVLADGTAVFIAKSPA